MDDLVERLRQYAKADDLHIDERTTLNKAADELEAVLAQPAAYPRSTHHVHRATESLPCYCPAKDDHPIGSEQTAAVDEAISNADLCRLSRVFNENSDLRLDQDRRINDWLGRRIAAALAGQQEQRQGIPEDYMAFTYMAVETIRSRMAELGFLVPRRVISEGVSAALSVQQKGSYEETLALALHSEETVAVQQAWEWAGGNPGIKASREDLEQALRDLDAVCDETHQGGSSSNRPASPARAPLDSAQLDLLVEAARAREEGGTVLCGGEAEPQVAVAEKPRPWPKDSVDQVRAVADVLAASPDPLSTAEIAARFTAKGRWKERLPKLLEMLVALGTAQELDGKFSA